MAASQRPAAAVTSAAPGRCGFRSQPGPVGGHRLDRHRLRRARSQGRSHRVGETGRPGPGRGDLLGHSLQPDHLVCGRSGQLAELGRGGQRLRGEAGVHTHRRQPSGGQEAPVHFGCAQLGPAGDVVSQFGVRRQAQDGRAQPPERETRLGVEHRTAWPARPLGQQPFHRRPVHVTLQHPVTVVVHQGLVHPAKGQFRRFVRQVHHDPPINSASGLNLFVPSRVTRIGSISSGGDLP